MFENKMFIKERNKGLPSNSKIIYDYRKYYLNILPVEMQTLMRFIFLLRSGNTRPVNELFDSYSSMIIQIVILRIIYYQ